MGFFFNFSPKFFFKGGKKTLDVKKRGAFTLVELLIALALFLIIGSLLFYLIIRALRSFSAEAGTTKKSVEVSINVAPITFDLKHIGYGISTNETSLVLSYCNGSLNPQNPACNETRYLNQKYRRYPVDNKTLLLKETPNIMRSPYVVPSMAFVLWNGTKATGYPKRWRSLVESYPYCIWLGDNKTLVDESACNETTYTGIAAGFPLDYNASCSDLDNPICCKDQNCTGIAYYLMPPTTSSHVMKSCVKGTYIFYRETAYRNDNSSNKTYLYGNSFGGSIYHVPLINCVSDWDMWFGIDTNGDGKPEKWINEIPYIDTSATVINNATILTNADLRKKLRVIKMYLLVQSTYSPDPTYDYCLHANCTADENYVVTTLPNGELIYLKTPKERVGNTDWTMYKWRVVEITVTTFPDIP